MSGSLKPGAAAPSETLEGFTEWQEIGRGGDATVYRAVQEALGREVAIKVLMVDDEESIRRFTREVQLMVSLGRQHPNIAKVLQIGTSSRGRPCIVMDYYELGSLDQRLATYHRLSADEVVQVGTVVADALSFAHGKGVLHRDVKPQNILILPTSYVLADFGIARLIDSAHTASSDRFSYRHASPQVLDGHPPSESDDVFSLGATLFHLLDGKPPFTRLDDEPDSALAYIKRVRIEEHRPIRRNDLPPALVSLIDRALMKDPRRRFSAAEFRDALASIGTEARSWSQESPMPPFPGQGMPQSLAAGGWTGIPGQAHSPEDLTSLRLSDMTGATGPALPPGALPPMPMSQPSAAYPMPQASATHPVSQASAAHPMSQASAAYPMPQASAAVPTSHPSAPYATSGPDMAHEIEPVRPSRPPFLTIGLSGIAIGVVLVVVYALIFSRPDPKGDDNPPTPARPVVVPNQNLAPRDLRITIDGSRATATWSAPIDSPTNLTWTNAGSKEALSTTPISHIGTNQRSVTFNVPPVWTQVCVSVTGYSGNQVGSAFDCQPR